MKKIRFNLPMLGVLLVVLVWSILALNQVFPKEWTGWVSFGGLVLTVVFGVVWFAKLEKKGSIGSVLVLLTILTCVVLSSASSNIAFYQMGFAYNASPITKDEENRAFSSRDIILYSVDTFFDMDVNGYTLQEPFYTTYMNDNEEDVPDSFKRAERFNVAHRGFMAIRITNYVVRFSYMLFFSAIIAMVIDSAFFTKNKEDGEKSE